MNILPTNVFNKNKVESRKLISPIEDAISSGKINPLQSTYTNSVKLTNSFEPIYVYRKVNTPFSEKSFYCQVQRHYDPDDFFELDDTELCNLDNYACSFSTDIEDLRNRIFRKRAKSFSKRLMKVSEGYLSSDLGWKYVKYIDPTHIMLFAYADTEFLTIFSSPKEV